MQILIKTSDILREVKKWKKQKVLLEIKRKDINLGVERNWAQKITENDSVILITELKGVTQRACSMWIKPLVQPLIL